MKKQRISWQEYDDAVESVAADIHWRLGKKLSRYKLVGVPRGGLVVAVSLSHWLGIEMCNEIPKFNTREKLIVVDDILDTGDTIFNLVNEGWKENGCLIAAPYTKPHSLIRPDFETISIPNDVWIEFPWENSNSLTERDGTI